MSWANNWSLSIDKPKADGGWFTSPWEKAEAQAYQTDEALKNKYGIELAKAATPFEAACALFGEETNKALWVSANWLNDPIVIASKDIYLKTVELSKPPLDREQLAAKVLELAEGEKILKNGFYVSTIETKDRIAAFKLYSDILGYTGKVEIDNSTKTFNHNEMIIKLVKAEEKKPVVIDNAPNTKSEMTNDKDQSPIKLKLVAAG